MEYSFIIRRAAVSDAPAIYSVLQQAFREYAEITGVKNLDALNETIADIEEEINNNIVYVAVTDNTVIGTIRVKISGDEACISRFAVSTAHRNIGVGEKLMNFVENCLKSAGINRVYLYTASHHRNLVRFYYGMGFYIDSVNYEKGYPRARMVKDF